MSELTGTAATVVLLRDSGAGPEVLLLERPTAGSFGGAWVFPGGRVDPEDRADGGSVAEGGGEDDGGGGDDGGGEAEAARRAGVRETEEETGLVLRPEDLVPLSCWIPPSNIPRRYQTWFFAAKAPAGAVRLNPGELLNYLWLSPSEALDRHRNGLMQLVPPTWVTLHSLAADASADAALARIAGTEPETFRTRPLAGHEPAAVLVWEGDGEYDGAAGESAGAAGPGRHRLVMEKTSWRYERTE
ncbi:MULTISPECIES: NUDIX hydrolase [unclassified Arthrobacter]|uniref:NUDIX hydrolase n=1 Tax=unclassified Arthrobacter TaxID=235627 RepID=UPI001E30E0FF|nr:MULTISPECIES: NUDIX hydrolase [unclassified Arthrobacter]MCC9145061.1 NUDIX hydrolase [Arthrobacter sp. zg-Y919]MDK1276289.1 NUDIX hydrolase [Arthrobacter sp. zg.Y919]WIB02106.1 NUDIX hydrolase [Arthrobacter sp. zg-Y919]